MAMSNDQSSSHGGAQQYGTHSAQNGSGPPNTHGWDNAARQAAEAAYAWTQAQMNKDNK
jgi:hypothetical protein